MTAADRAPLEADIREAGQMAREYRPGLRNRAVRLVKCAIGSTWHQPFSRTVTELLEKRRDGLWLEIGSGVSEPPPNQVNLDIAPFPNVHVAATATNIPFGDGTFDVVRNHAVLEHVREPDRVIAEILRVLRPGGHVYTEVPFLQHFHAYPNDFQRYTIQGLRRAFREFEIVESGVCVGPSSTLTAVAADWFELWTFSRRRWINDAVRVLPLVLLLPVKYLDWILLRNPRAHELASGVYVLARKP